MKVRRAIYSLFFFCFFENDLKNKIDYRKKIFFLFFLEQERVNVGDFLTLRFVPAEGGRMLRKRDDVRHIRRPEVQRGPVSRA